MNEPPPPPASLALFVEVLGLDDTLRLIEASGGISLWVPKGIGNSSTALREKFESDFGAALTRKLIRAFGGGYVKVPLCENWRTQLYHHQGMAVRDIARKLGCADDTVWRRLKAAKGDRDQFAFEFRHTDARR